MYHSETLAIWISDFSLATHIPSMWQTLRAPVGGGLYMAPEMILQQSYSIQVDIWSVGILLASLWNGNTYLDHVGAIHEFDVVEAVIRTAKHGVTLKPRSRSREDHCTPFLQLMLQSDPQVRPTAKRLLEHDFLN